MIKLTTGEKIDDLIKKSGKSGEKVLKEINEKYSFSISKPTLSDIINDVDKGYSYKYFEIFAKYFNVSTDYLLGLTDAPTPLKTDEGKALRVASDFTGLSINAIKQLPKITKKLKLFNTQYLIDDLLTGDYLDYIINCFNEYKIVKNKNENIIKEVVNIINQTPFKSNINKDYSHLNLFRISELIEDELKDGDTANKIRDLLKDYDEDYPNLMMFEAQKKLNEFFYHIDDKIKEGKSNETQEKKS